MRTIALLSFLFISATSAKIHTLYNSLDPKSIPQHLAFYQLYPESTEGQKALHDAWNLLTDNQTAPSNAKLLTSLSPAVDTFVSLITKEPLAEKPKLTNEELQLIDTAAARLHNRKLKGRNARSEAEVLALPSEDIDLAHALFLSDGAEGNRSYEAMIDLMALQIQTKLPKNATPEQKIDAINAFIFDEMGFRFPPHSLYSQDIDLYTFLPAVLDSRRGVCLGVSILYLCIAQRLDLPLEIITPPGHIYIRHKNRNIETTARGVHVDSEEYLSIETRSLQERTLKEVIGMAHFNDAARHWHTQDYEKSRDSYRRALPYMPDDMLLKELMGYNALILGDPEGEALLRQTLGHIPDHAVSGENMAADYLLGHIDAEGIATIFLNVDENLESIKNKQEKLKETLAKHPKFRAGIFALATTWLQLHRLAEAAELLERYHRLDPTNPTVEYYLSALSMVRMDYNKARLHYDIALELAAARGHHPKALKELKKALHLVLPQP